MEMKKYFSVGSSCVELNRVTSSAVEGSGL